MEKYVRNFKRRGKWLELFVKIPFGRTYKDVVTYFKQKYDDEHMSFLQPGLDATGKYVILVFVLRNMEDKKYGR